MLVIGILNGDIHLPADSVDNQVGDVIRPSGGLLNCTVRFMASADALLQLGDCAWIAPGIAAPAKRIRKVFSVIFRVERAAFFISASWPFRVALECLVRLYLALVQLLVQHEVLIPANCHFY